MLDFPTLDFPLNAWRVRIPDRRLRHFDIFFKVDLVMKAFETEPNGPNVENFQSWKSDCVTLGKL